MEFIAASAKRGIHEDNSEEQSNSLLTKTPASGSLASGQNGILVPT